MQNGRGKKKYSSWSNEDLKNFRINAGMSRRDMAEDLSVSYRMYCYYESGHTKVDLPLEYAVRWLSINGTNGPTPLNEVQNENI